MEKSKSTAANLSEAFCVFAQQENVFQEERRYLVANGRARVKRRSQ